MPEPFKNFFNPDVVTKMAGHIGAAWPEFDQKTFISDAIRDFEAQELKERAMAITDALESHLPEDFPRSVGYLLDSLNPEEVEEITMDDGGDAGVRGWAIMCFTEYVARRGRDDLDLSLSAMREMTKRFSAEFSIRHFLNDFPEQTLKVMESWVLDENHHVRRLVSEGTRPKLPWAMNLPLFREKPQMILPLLEQLKDDPSEYVRRSVANNLNEMAKDHPDLVAEIAGRWMKGASKNRKRLVSHACRTLIKKGHPGALEALGFGKPNVEVADFKLMNPVVEYGTGLEFELDLKSKAAEEQNLVLDYAIHHVKANGSLAPKVFKWKNLALGGKASHKASKLHKIKPITTRVYYPGTHKVELLINGESYGIWEFELKMA